MNLLEASEAGDLDKVKILLKREQNDNIEDEEPSFFLNQALKLSSEKGHLKVVQYLVENGADNLSWALKSASQNRYLQVVKYLVEKGADIHTNDNLPLRLSVANKDLNMVKFLVENGADYDAFNGEALMTSITEGYNDIAKFLIDSGADIHIDDDYAVTACVEAENIEILALLIENGADIHASDEHALLRAVVIGNHKIVKLLLDNGADVNVQYNGPIEIASENGHLKIVELLINNGADPIYNDSLIFSSEQNHIDVTKYLLKQEADVSRKEHAALRFSSSKGHLEIVKLLVANGSDIHAQNEYALRKSSEYGNFEMVEYLIEQGADVQILNNQALTLSSKNGRFNIVKLLVENGADVQADNNHALLLASSNNNQNIIVFLINFGADINVNNDEVLKNATKNGNLDLIKFLVENGAGSIKEAMKIAREMKRADILQYFKYFNKGLLKESVKKIISLYKDKKIFYKWQKLCSNLDNKDLPELRNLASLHGIADTGSKKKQDICKILNTEYQEQMLKPVECQNETTILGDPIALIPKPLLFTVKEGNFNYCFNILELVESLKAGDTRNPWTRNQLPVDEIKKSMLRLREILIESKLSFVNILEEIKNNDIMDRAGIFRFSVVNLVSRLKYPPKIEDVIKMDPSQVENMFELLKENPLTKVYGSITLDNLVKESTRILNIDDSEKDTRLAAYEVYLNEVFNQD